MRAHCWQRDSPISLCRKKKRLWFTIICIKISLLARVTKLNLSKSNVWNSWSIYMTTHSSNVTAMDFYLGSYGKSCVEHTDVQDHNYLKKINGHAIFTMDEEILKCTTFKIEQSRELLRATKWAHVVASRENFIFTCFRVSSLEFSSISLLFIIF